MKMNLNQKIYTYFSRLGYGDLSIQSDVKVENLNIDMVIYKEQKPFIVVEIKKSNSLLLKKNIDFNPYIEELQYKSVITNSPYYVLTDGDSFLWLKTNDSGRPELLSEPLIEKSSLQIPFEPKEEFELALKKIKEIYMVNYEIDMPLNIILRWLQEKVLEIDKEFIFDMHDDLIYSLKSVDLEAANRITRNINIDNIKPKVFTSAFQKVFNEYEKKRLPYTPKWISDLTYKFLKIDTEKMNLLSIFNTNEALLSSLMLEDNLDIENVYYTDLVINDKKNKIKEIYKLYGKIKGMNISSFIIQDSTINKLFRRKMFNNIIISFFQIDQLKKNNYLEKSITEEVFINSVIDLLRSKGRIIAVIPDKYLNSENYESIRQAILKRTKIKAIVSLPRDSITSYHFPKSSILVLDKLEEQIDQKEFILMAELGNILINFEENDLKIPEVEELFQALELTDVQEVITKESIWSIPYLKLNTKSFLPRRNNDFALDNTQSLDTKYPTFLLKELCLRIDRGTKAKLNKLGETPLIGPAAVRSMEIKYSELNKTSFQELPSRVIRVMENDIVMNNIGKYTGAASIINKELAGIILNQNVVLIRPNPQQVLPEYLVAVLNSSYVENQIKTYVKGRGLYSLKNETIQNLKIPLPSFNQQKSIAMEIEKNKHNYKFAMEEFEKSKLTYINSIKYLLNEEGEE